MRYFWAIDVYDDHGDDEAPPSKPSSKGTGDIQDLQAALARVLLDMEDSEVVMVNIDPIPDREFSR